MSSPYRINRRLIGAVIALASLMEGCSRSDEGSAYGPSAQQPVRPVVLTQLFPGGDQPPPEDPRGKIYDGNAYHIANGKQYFSWYNCNGCHFNGGGGIGPPFMDKAWIYGGRIDQIYNSIAEGRPNGMPTWAGKIPDSQIWELAAYVRSLSTPSVKSEQPPNAPPEPTTPPDDPNHPGGVTISEATIGPRPK